MPEQATQSAQLSEQEMSPADKFISFTRLKKLAEAELKQVKAKLAELDPIVQEWMAEAGLQSFKTEGDVTVYLHSQVWVKPDLRDGDDRDVAMARACELMKQVGLGDYVQEKFNTNSLSAWWRELRQTQLAEDPTAEPTMPDGLDKVLAATEVVQCRVRGA